MATYTPKEYVKKLNKFALSIQDIKPFYEATNEVIIMQEDRIFNKGLDSKGSPVGTYSTEPIYISLRATPKKFPPRGKNGQTKFKDGKQHRSGYFAGGYYQFKQAIGRAGAGRKINLELFGHFRKGFANSANPAKLNKTGFEVVYSVKHTGANPKGKVEGIIENYPQAFKLSVKEREYILEKFREIFIDAILNKK